MSQVTAFGRLINAAILTMTLALVVGCSGAYKVHPGAAGYVSGTPTATQTFASHAYDSLVAADQVIQSTRQAFLAGQFPQAAMPAIHSAFNGLVTAYDNAQAAWIAFNDSASKGGSASQATVEATIAALQTALNQLAQAKGGN